jgi:hypothetical protein
MKCKNGHSNSAGSDFCGDCGVKIGQTNQNGNFVFLVRYIPILLLMIGVFLNYNSTSNELNKIKNQPIVVDDTIRNEIDSVSSSLVFDSSKTLPAQQFRIAEWQKDLLGLNSTRLLDIKNQLQQQNNFIQLQIKFQNYLLVIISGLLALIAIIFIENKNKPR